MASLIDYLRRRGLGRLASLFPAGDDPGVLLGLPGITGDGGNVVSSPIPPGIIGLFTGIPGTVVTDIAVDGQSFTPFGQIVATSEINAAGTALRRSNPNAIAAHYLEIGGIPAPVVGPEFEIIVTFAAYSGLFAGIALGNSTGTTFLDFDGYLFLFDATNAYVQEVENSGYGNLSFAACAITTNAVTPPSVRFKLRGGSQGRLRIYRESAFGVADWTLVTGAGYRAFTGTTLFGPWFGGGAGWSDTDGLHIAGFHLTDSVSLLPTDINVVCFGNSLTQGSGATTPWPMLMAAGLDAAAADTYCVIRKGVSGRDLATLLTDYPTHAAPLAQAGYGRNILVIQEGTNSISAGGQTGAQCLATLDALIALALVDFDAVVVPTCPPSGLITGADETDRLAYNAGILARDNGTTIFAADVCADAVFDAEIDAQNATYYLNPPTDATHLKNAGYVVMETYIRAAVIAAS